MRCDVEADFLLKKEVAKIEEDILKFKIWLQWFLKFMCVSHSSDLVPFYFEFLKE